MRIRWIGIPVAATAAVLAGCDRDAGIGPGAVINIEAPATRLTEGQTLALRVRAGGQPVSGSAVQWESRDRSTVTVDGEGVVRGVAPGVAYVVAQSGRARDSVQLTVRFAQLAGNGVAVRVAGAGNTPVRLGGAALLMRGVNNGVENTAIFADNRTVDASATSRDVFAIGDSVLHIWLPKRAEVGVSEVGAPVVEMTSHLAIRADSLGNGVFFTIYEQAQRREKLYIAVKPARLEVMSLELPPAPGNEPGRITGSISFEAASFQLVFGDNGTQTLTPLADTTVTIYAEFSTPIYHTLLAGGQITLAGPARHAGTFGINARALAAGDGSGGVTVRIGPTLINRNVIGAESVFDYYLWLQNPAAGTVSFGDFPASQLEDSLGSGSTPWSRATLASFIRDNPEIPAGHTGPKEHVLSRSGSLRDR